MTSNKGRLAWLPEGWRVVPIGLTDTMAKEGIGARDRGEQITRTYQAMILSAPELPPFEWSEERVEAAAAALYGFEMHGSWAWEYQRNKDLKNNFLRKAKAALNAAIGRG